MPGRIFLSTPLEQVARAYASRIAVEDPGPRLDIAPGQEVPVLRVRDGQREIVGTRWGMVMSGRVNARGRPVMETIVNARSETLFRKSAFEGVLRGVLPVDGWYEWTGTGRRKLRWRISARDGRVLSFAAIHDVWQGPGGVKVAQMATVTCDPNDDLRDIHHRMPVLLDKQGVEIWLTGNETAASASCVPAAEGFLRIEEAGG